MSHGIDSARLARYFAETCSAEEKARISAWMREDPARLLSKCWGRSSTSAPMTEEARVESIVEEGTVSMRSLQGPERNNAVVLRARQQGVVAEGASHVTLYPAWPEAP